MNVRRVGVAAGVLLVGTALGACSTSGAESPPASSAATGAGTGGVTTTCGPATGGGTNPLTGLPGAPTGPLLAVKVSNTVTRDANARPQSGLPKADQVWVEEVEAGRTRFVAVFGSQYPNVVGPVRSGRETDLELLPAFGRSGIAYAGANAKVQKAFTDASAAGRIVDLGKDAKVDGQPVRSGQGTSATYFTDPSRRGTASFYANACALVPWAAKGGATAAAPMGFTFGPPLAGGGSGAKATVRWSKVSIATFTYNDGSYAVGWDGAALTDRESAAPLTADSVVVLRVRVSTSALTAAPPYVVPISSTLGSGPATVLRDGKSWTGSWSRATLSDPMVVRDGAGTAITLKPGRTWVALLPSTAAALSRIPGDTRSLAVQ